MMKRLASALMAVGVPIASRSAQVPPAPPRVPVPAFRFPHVESTTLPTGMRVEIVEDHSVAIVAVRAVLGANETFDPPGKEGLYQLTLSSLREGTTSRTAAQIADEAAHSGTAVSPTAFTTTPANFEKSLALMGDMLMHPSFPEAGVARRRATNANTVRLRATSPVSPARAAFFAIVDGRDDPVARAYYATDSSVNAITRDDVQRFYSQYFAPQSTTLIVTGDVTKASAIATITRVFGGWPKIATLSRGAAVTPPPAQPTTIYLLDVPGTTTYLFVGDRGPVRNAPDVFAADIMGTVLRDRFVARLRDKHAFMYAGATGFSWNAAPHASEFAGSTNIAAAKTDSALVEWLDMLRGIRGLAPVTESELDAARKARTGNLWTGSDGPDSVATRLAEVARDGLAPDFLNAFASGMRAVTPADVTAAARRYIDVDHLAIVVSGDRKVLEPALRAANIAPVVVVDRNGRPLPDQP